jgi:DNA-binding NtrC family response regulator
MTSTRSSADGGFNPEGPRVAICVDDDPLVGTVFLAAAARAGVHGVFATGAVEFQRAIAKTTPCVVVLDQVLPDSTGAEMILWIRGLQRCPKVIVIGGDELYLDSAAALVRASGLELVAALRKPLRLEAFSAAISAAAAPAA